MFFQPIHKDFVKLVVDNLGDEVRTLLVDYANKLIVAGGFVRDSMQAKKPHDIDIYAITPEVMEEVERVFNEKFETYLIHSSENAVTYLVWNNVGKRYDDTRVQFVKGFYGPARKILPTFDFTVNQAAVWWNGDEWVGMSSMDFGLDIALGRLVYNVDRPIMHMNIPSETMRMIRFLQDGYSIDREQVANVLGGLFSLLTLKDPQYGRDLLKRVLASYGYETFIPGELLDAPEVEEKKAA